MSGQQHFIIVTEIELHTQGSFVVRKRSPMSSLKTMKSPGL